MKTEPKPTDGEIWRTAGPYTDADVRNQVYSTHGTNLAKKSHRVQNEKHKRSKHRVQ